MPMRQLETYCSFPPQTSLSTRCRLSLMSVSVAPLETRSKISHSAGSEQNGSQLTAALLFIDGPLIVLSCSNGSITQNRVAEYVYVCASLLTLLLMSSDRETQVITGAAVCNYGIQ